MLVFCDIFIVVSRILSFSFNLLNLQRLLLREWALIQTKKARPPPQEYL